MPPTHGTYIYPFAPFVGFDFVYRFPFGTYPYNRYGYPDYPYRFIFPPPGCVTTELEGHGSVRIDVPQREATVLVDGFYIGVVDDFNGTLEHLNLTPGPHHIELHAPGFEPTVFDVNIEVGHLIVYRTPMRPGGSMPSGSAHPSVIESYGSPEQSGSPAVAVFPTPLAEPRHVEAPDPTCSPMASRPRSCKSLNVARVHHLGATIEMTDAFQEKTP